MINYCKVAKLTNLLLELHFIPGGQFCCDITSHVLSSLPIKFIHSAQVTELFSFEARVPTINIARVVCPVSSVHILAPDNVVI